MPLNKQESGFLTVYGYFSSSVQATGDFHVTCGRPPRVHGAGGGRLEHTLSAGVQT